MKTVGLLALATLLYSLAGFFALLFRIAFVVAIYYDAKTIGIKNKSAWIVLAIFFPLIVAIVYVCSRKDAVKVVPKMCTGCHATVDSNTLICPYCNSTAFVDYVLPDSEKNKRVTKALVITSIVLCVITSALFVSGVCVSQSAVGDYSDSYLEDFERDFGEDFGEQFEDDFSRENPFNDFGKE